MPATHAKLVRLRGFAERLSIADSEHQPIADAPDTLAGNLLTLEALLLTWDPDHARQIRIYRREIQQVAGSGGSYLTQTRNMDVQRPARREWLTRHRRADKLRAS